MKKGAHNAFSNWVHVNFDRLEDGMPLMLMWLQDEYEEGVNYG